jgi:hypothetical protein
MIIPPGTTLDLVVLDYGAIVARKWGLA